MEKKRERERLGDRDVNDKGNTQRARDDWMDKMQEKCQRAKHGGS